MHRRKTAAAVLILLTWLGSSTGSSAARAEQAAKAPEVPAAVNANRPRVLVIATGGTIAGVGYAGQKQRKSTDLVEAVPEIREIADVHVEDPIAIASSQFTPQILLDLARHVRKVLSEDPGLAGIVITQGTDSLEETSFFFDLLLPADRPIVFTAAMRLPTERDADGPRNLIDAVRVAASPAARGLGVLVAMNDEIHAAREVHKTHASAVDAFQSTGSGPVGYVDQDAIYWLHKPLRRVTIDTDAVEPRVDLVVVTVGSDGREVKAAVDSGAKGLVIELFGRGNLPGAMLQNVIDAIKKQVVIVFTTRTGDGRVIVSPNFQKGGVISGQDLDGLKARMALIAALGKTQDHAVIQGYFDRLAGKV